MKTLVGCFMIIRHYRRKGDYTLQRSPIHQLSRPLDHIVTVEKERNVTKVSEMLTWAESGRSLLRPWITQLTSLAVRLHVIQVLYSFSSKTCILFWKPSRLRKSWMISPVSFKLHENPRGLSGALLMSKESDVALAGRWDTWHLGRWF